MLKSATSPIGRSLGRFLADERAATSIEYAIIAAGISIVIVGTVASLGSNVKTMFSNVSTALK